MKESHIKQLQIKTYHIFVIFFNDCTLIVNTLNTYVITHNMQCGHNLIIVICRFIWIINHKS